MLTFLLPQQRMASTELEMASEGDVRLVKCLKLDNN